MKILGSLGITVGAAVLSAVPLSLHFSPATLPSVSLDTADARLGRPLTPLSVAGVHRRAYRRGYGAGLGYGGWGYGLGAGALAAGAVAGSSYYGGYGGYPYYGGYSSYYPYSGYSGYYGGYPGYYGGHANRSYVTGRPTLFPRYYGGSYAYSGYYRGGYPGYYGGYANRSYVTGRPTLFPRYYGGPHNW